MANLGYIQVTRDCNQHCRFCSNPPIETKQTFDRVCAQIEDLAERGYDGVILTGGEPTLVPFLPDAIRFCSGMGIAARIITNGQRLSNLDYLELLVAAGLDHVHVSLHSSRSEVQAWITKNPRSFENIAAALSNLAVVGVTADINTVICAQNADHLEETVAWVLEHHPHIRHFVWNNLDPDTDRCRQNPEVIPRLADFEVSLHRAMALVARSRRTFRVERVPLCYMADFARCSTETRKIVKKEERVVHFLDEHKGTVLQTEWTHFKAQACRVCRLDSICAGLYGAPEFFDPNELYPLFIDPALVRRQVLESSAESQPDWVPDA
ncbi:MAG: radical SAM protein [Deltaproteobacteria bacterium]|nr:radical SAM protein [Deltaproteobacteria bacterium]